MAKTTPKTFSAVLTRQRGDKLNWTVITVPFDCVKLWGPRGQIKVKGDINGFEFRTSLFPKGDGRHMMLVNKQMQKGGGVQPGMDARFRLEPDLEERVTKVPAELLRVLDTSKRLRKFFDSMPLSMKNYVAGMVVQAKQASTKQRRAEQIAEWLLEIMEAEIELPPILRQSFARHPEAAKAWSKMSPAHRRRHLWGIFFYRNLDSRLRRIEKAMAEMAGKRSEEDDL